MLGYGNRALLMSVLVATVAREWGHPTRGALGTSGYANAPRLRVQLPLDVRCTVWVGILEGGNMWLAVRDVQGVFRGNLPLKLLSGPVLNGGGG